jgi:hypothetical protein
MRKLVTFSFLLLVINGLAYSQSLTTVILPRYIEGVNPTNLNRIPFAFRVRMTALNPDSTYNYFNQVVLSSDSATTSGAGNCIFVSMSGNFVRTTNPSLSTAGACGSFTADGTGAYEGWFITEPTGSARFVPGAYIFMRVILNDGEGGTKKATELTTADSVRVVNLGTASDSLSGSGLRCTSSWIAKNFVFLYDSTGGGGRPISGSLIESDGTDNSVANKYAAFYGNNVDGVAGAFGLVLPNQLPNGVRRMEERSLTDGTIVASATDSDGVWPSGANTVNPSDGTNEIVLAGTDLVTYSLTVSGLHGTVTKIPDYPGYQHGTSVQLSATPDSGYHLVIWSGDVPTGHETDNPLSIVMDQNRVITAYFAVDTSAPILTTPTFASVTDSSAIMGARIASNGNDSITERGIVWSTSPGPTTSDNKNTTSDTSGVYTVLVNGLPAGTLVHFRGYAVNSAGTGYSPEDSLYTLSVEPTTHVGSFMAKALPGGQIGLSWSPASGATGYIVLQRVGSNPTGLPKDAAGYSVGDSVGDAVVATETTSGTTDSARIPALRPATSYHFLIFPYAWDGSHAATYNYKTDGVVPIDSATTLNGPALTEVILPQYIEGINGTNTNRIPFAYRAKLTGLLARATYRFANQVVVSTDTDSSDGGGNCIFVAATGDFARASSPALDSPDSYGTFATDSSGAYEGWFVTEPTGNDRFVPGRYVFMRIWLNDGGAGTIAVTYLTTVDSVRVLKLDPSAEDSAGTGLRCTSPANPKDFVFAYDNVAGTGRPISGSFIESDGTANSIANKYAEFYANHVDGVDGAFGIVLPNMLPNGIRRIERRSRTTGAVVVHASDANGIWPSGASTVNPSGGTFEIVLLSTDVQWTTAVQTSIPLPKQFGLSQNYPNPFNPTTMINYQLPKSSFVKLKVFDVLGREVVTLVSGQQDAGFYEVAFAGGRYASGVYFYRIDAVGNDGEKFESIKKLVLMK